MIISPLPVFYRSLQGADCAGDVPEAKIRCDQRALWWKFRASDPAPARSGTHEVETGASYRANTFLASLRTFSINSGGLKGRA